jgi:hypothetical protein
MQKIKKKSRILNNNYIKTFTAIFKFSKSITDLKLLLRVLRYLSKKLKNNFTFFFKFFSKFLSKITFKWVQTIKSTEKFIDSLKLSYNSYCTLPHSNRTVPYQNQIFYYYFN